MPYGINSRRIVIVLSSFFLALAIPSFVYSREVPVTVQELTVFHSRSCHRCIEVKNELMPRIERIFKDAIKVEYLDIADIENYRLLLSLREKYRANFNIVLPVFYSSGHFLNGDEAVKTKVERFIKDSISVPLAEKQNLPAPDLLAYFRTFQPLTVISAGLIDGINPCAFTVIVFFLSFLALQGYRKRDLVIIGLAFIFSVFLTYFLLGIGLFGFLYSLKSFWLITRIFNFSIGIFSIILGVFALYDFFKFKKTHAPDGLVLQLPKAVKDRIHSVIGLRYRETRENAEVGKQKKHIINLVIGALTTGFLVSLLEAVCTGQVYLPTITFVLKASVYKLQALGYLLLYNLMFIIPLLIVFLFALAGATSEQFSVFFKKHILTIKILMAALFFSLGIFLIWRA
jgi:cytochrome c biogenesis protein CcdA